MGQAMPRAEALLETSRSFLSRSASFRSATDEALIPQRNAFPPRGPRGSHDVCRSRIRNPGPEYTAGSPLFNSALQADAGLRNNGSDLGPHFSHLEFRWQAPC